MLKKISKKYNKIICQNFTLLNLNFIMILLIHEISVSLNI